ncbi:dienelactone hydrolase family protein [Aeromicrobium sp.]|uniref:dienelactone hydrolase family protein n=1 Tax=Aeromicrobium sp. TaxID=1871063 RepID=UPI0019CCFFCB|nr:dienelactone hydrolase family protein [Aeromicrobium sp.]MBC7632984.1 dienelactone hydrolase family protein [Aeromicrobium sp.]
MTSAPTGTLDGWTVVPFTVGAITHDCYEKGSGPGVVLIPEIPGMTPEVLGLAEHLVESGFTVVVPSLFGTPGRAMSPAYVAGVVAKLCVASEFRAFATGAARPVSEYLRGVARALDARTPGKGVGVIGMCFTGGFALAAAVDDSVIAPVMSQPSVPFPLGRKRQADVGLSSEELTTVKARTENDGLCVMGLRFSEDKAVSPLRFKALAEQLGDAFEVIELDSSKGNAGGFSSSAHSVLTHEMRDADGHPAREARTKVVAFLKKRLNPS